MMTNKLWLLIVIAFVTLTMGVVIMACGDDDDDDEDVDDDTSDDDSGDDDTGADDDVADDDVVDDDTGDDDVIEPGTIGGTAQDFKSEAPIPGATVEAIDDTTGESFDPPVTGTTDANGYIQLTLPTDYALATVGIKVTYPNYKATVQYHFIVGLTNETFLAISDTLVFLMSTLVGVAADPTKGHTAGSVYWGDPTDETPVGCSEVTFDPASGETHYFDHGGLLGDVPTTDRDIATAGDPQNGEGTNPGNGYFLSLNADPTDTGVTITANADGATASTVVPKVEADTVAIATIYFSKDDYGSNPQGDWCTE